VVEGIASCRVDPFTLEEVHRESGRKRTWEQVPTNTNGTKPRLPPPPPLSSSSWHHQQTWAPPPPFDPKRHKVQAQEDENDYQMMNMGSHLMDFYSSITTSTTTSVDKENDGPSIVVSTDDNA